MTRPRAQTRAPKPPLLWTGILFAFAANGLLVNGVDALVRAAGLGITFEALATMMAPVLVGVATAFYTRVRGGMHAFIGGLLSVPLLAFTVFDGNWRFAILAGAFCTLGGTITELLLRGQTRRP